MDSLNVEAISEAKLAKLLPLLKEYNSLLPVLQAEAAGAEVILRWIANSVEFKLKNEALKSTREKLTEVLIETNMLLSQRQAQVQTLDKKIAHAKEESQLRQYISNELYSSLPASRHNDFLIKEHKRFAEGHTMDPVISFSSAQKPSPKRNTNCGALVLETRTSEIHCSKKPLLLAAQKLHTSSKTPTRHKDEFIDEQENSIKVEATEVLTSCKTKLSKYFCG